MNSIPWDALDKKIKPVVHLLRDNDVDTFSSCEGGEGHSHEMPSVLFHGGDHEGLRVLWLLESHGYHVWELSRHWASDRDLPYWVISMRTLHPSRPLTSGEAR